ncbi:MAG: ubiquitin-conjugating enzyme E2, partial [Desulforhopalus sp.]
MSVAPDQLAAIYQKLQDLFNAHPVISIQPTKGDPPDHYEVTYNITGLCKDGGDAVTETSNTTIDISIPFGFPHFPPSCKPKSEIFHPDFDTAAICLGDFWHQDCALEDLVIHLGRMINGEVYSTQNAFNEDASEYYLSHQDIFPLNQIAWNDSNPGIIAAKGSVSRVDTLEEEDLLPDFNFFALEKEEFESEAVGEGLAEQTAHDDSIHDQLFLLEGQKKFYQLLDVANNCSLPAEELDQFVQNGRFQIAKAEELYRAAQLKETQGEREEALRLYADVGNTVSDFPAINSDIQRVTHSFLNQK